MMGYRLFLILSLLLASVQAGIAAERQTPIVVAVSKARDAVVNIRTEQINQRRPGSFFGFGDSIFDQFFQDMLPPRTYKTQSLGSGVIIAPAGYILTNAHVVDKASKIYVALTDQQKELEARLVGQDERIDLAVLQIIESGEYPYLSPARSDDLLLGEAVIAIGNPLGLGHSITTGIVSSLKRRIRINEHLSSVFIQTDALINPGNSGGPLININGELIGINTAIARQAQGIGFSIPIDTAKRVLKDLIAYGRVRRGFFGAVVGAVSANFVRSFGAGGVLIDEIIPDSPARQAGLRIADVILSVDRIPVTEPAEYHSLLRTYTPGDELEMEFLRGDKVMQRRVTLAALPTDHEMAYTRRVFGFTVGEGGNALIVKEIVKNSPAAAVGMRKGDVIARVGGNNVTDLNDFKRVIADRLGQTPLSFTVVRDNIGYRIELP